MDLTTIRAEIEHTRQQIQRQRREIRELQRAGIPTSSAEDLLGRMQSKVDELCSERDRQLGEQRRIIPVLTRSFAGRSSGASDELVRRKRG